jgi:hypothetical protein
MRSKRMRVLATGVVAILIGICAQTGFSGPKSQPESPGDLAVDKGIKWFPCKRRTVAEGRTAAKHRTFARASVSNRTAKTSATQRLLAGSRVADSLEAHVAARRVLESREACERRRPSYRDRLCVRTLAAASR